MISIKTNVGDTQKCLKYRRGRGPQFPLMPMGVLAPWSVHARPSAQPPIDMSGNFPAHVSAESPSKISPNPSEVMSEVQNSKTILEFCPTHYVILH